jgi:hypothetical protein
MSRPMDRQRLKRLGIAGALAAVSLVLALVLTWADARQAWQPEVSGPVLPDWSGAVAAAAEIEIDSAQDHFTLVRGADGWIMPSRDDHPVLTERLARLDAWMAALDYVGARTADPGKHARLGLADAGEEGAATRVTVRGESGVILVDILLGRAGEPGLYVRFPGRNRTYAARSGEAGAEMPAIAEAGDWLDLDFLELGANAVARAEIAPETGPAYRLERPSPSVRNFALREPGGWTLITAAAGNGPASALSRVRFRDVRSAARLEGETVAHHIADTFAGVRVRLDVLALGETRWAVLQAEALTDDARPQAAAINQAAQGWAFLLSDLTLDRLIRPLDQLADPRPETDTDAP